MLLHIYSDFLRACSPRLLNLPLCLAALQLSLFFSSSAQDLTITWGPEIQLTENYSGGLCPRLAVWDDAVHVVWSSLDHSLRYRAVIRASFDRGASWRPARRISNPHALDDVNPAIAAWRNDCHVVMQHQSLVPYWFGTGLQSSPNYGLSWPGLPQNLIEYGFHPAVSVWENSVNIVAQDGDYVYHRLSTNGGLSFQPQDTIANLGCSAQPLRMLAWQNCVFVVYMANWSPTNQSEIFFQRSTNGGHSFEPYAMLSTEDLFHSQLPSLAATESGDVYVSWKDYKYSPYAIFGDILMRHSSDFGAHWNEEAQITFDHRARLNAVAAQQDQVYAVWEGHPTLSLQESELFFAYSENEGQSWSDRLRLTSSHQVSSGPDLIAQNDTLHLVWWDRRQVIDHIYYKQAIIDQLTRLVATSARSIEALTSSDFTFRLFPNPFNAQIAVDFALDSTARVNLSVTNIKGELVKLLFDGILGNGNHQFIWNTENDLGTISTAGVYIFQMVCDNELRFSQKALYLK